MKFIPKKSKDLASVINYPSSGRKPGANFSKGDNICILKYTQQKCSCTLWRFACSTQYVVTCWTGRRRVVLWLIKEPVWDFPNSWNAGSVSDSATDFHLTLGNSMSMHQFPICKMGILSFLYFFFLVYLDCKLFWLRTVFCHVCSTVEIWSLPGISLLRYFCNK